MVLKNDTDSNTSMAVTTDNRFLVTIGGECSLRVWSLLHKKKYHRFIGHDDIITSIAVTSDNKYVISGSEDRTVRVWNLADRKLHSVLKNLQQQRITQIAVSDNNKHVAVGGYSSAIIVWNIEEQREEIVFDAQYRIYSIVFSNDNKYIVSCGDFIRVWDLEQKKQVAILEENNL